MLHDDIQYLPIELQAALVDMHSSGASTDRLNRLILLMLADREAKTTSLQMDLVKIHDSINLQIGRLGDKLSDDLRAQNGAGNQMIVDIHTMVQQQGSAVSALRAEFQQAGEQLTDLEGRAMQLEVTVAEHSQSRDRSTEERRLLRMDMDASKQHRATMQRTLDTALPAIEAAIRDLDTRHGTQIEALTAQLHDIQLLLELAGSHDGAHEAGG